VNAPTKRKNEANVIASAETGSIHQRGTSQLGCKSKTVREKTTSIFREARRFKGEGGRAYRLKTEKRRSDLIRRDPNPRPGSNGVWNF